MKTKVTFYTKSGEWYDQCFIDIKNINRKDNNELRRIIYNEQTCLLSSTEKEFYILVEGSWISSGEHEIPYSVLIKPEI